jgi:hypothetical protein
VRTALLTFFKDCLMYMDKDVLAPFMATLVAFARSAMTHIDDAIRRDSVNFLDVCVTLSPQQLEPFQSKILRNYVFLISSESNVATAASKKAPAQHHGNLGSHQGRIHVMKSLCHVLHKMNAYNQGEEDKYWYVQNFMLKKAPLFPVDRATVEWKENVLHYPMPCAHYDNLVPADPHQAFSALGLSTETKTSPSDTQVLDITGPLDMYMELKPFLVAIWLECAPAVFEQSDGKSVDALQALQLVIELVRILWRQAFCTTKHVSKPSEAWMRENMAIVLQQILLFFPFGSDSLYMDDRVKSMLMTMNITCSELVALYLLTSNQTHIPSWAARIIDYTRDLLRPQEILLETSQFTALLPVVWILLSSLDTVKQAQLFTNVLAYTAQCRPQSLVKFASAEFLYICLTVEKHPHYLGTFRPHATFPEACQSYLQGVPKVLWILKTDAPKTSLVLLHTLLAMMNQANMSAKVKMHCTCTRLGHSVHPAVPRAFSVRLAPLQR